MHARLLLALLAPIGLLAFAPAPFPRKNRPATSILDMNSLEGTWKVERVEQSVRGGYNRSPSMITHIRIQGGNWTFMRGNGGTLRPTNSFRLALHPKRAPVWLDGMRGLGKSPSMIGIVRRAGDTVEVLYRFGGTRPDSFERPPVGCWRLTLRRSR